MSETGATEQEIIEDLGNQVLELGKRLEGVRENWRKTSEKLAAKDAEREALKREHEAVKEYKQAIKDHSQDPCQCIPFDKEGACQGDCGPANARKLLLALDAAEKEMGEGGKC